MKQIEPLTNDYKQAVREAAEVVKKGGIILYPTDTIWGLGCDATNEQAVQRIYKIKKRAESKSMLILIDTDAKLSGLMEEVPSIAYDLIDASVSPLTIIYPKGRNVAPSLLSEERTIGIRITKEAFSQALCKAIRVPLVSTSANLSGDSSPSIFSEISSEIKEAVDYIVPVRQKETTPAKASQIIALGIHGEVKIIRS
ncbi:L-threonylcarbamoyladenylate synthase [Porphyromonas circumdentaria]|uniref:L-threonylcarbamoyladenylate synthase n=1 Tax=Porphyromonas circumdentaria TaxID=29524 RepID=A0A1T4LHV7_9PORP|nr:L-threonylcarbamoyladenylate synthase [Porphyromonas circumdentaria]MBB6275257.1 L-threonylcarbamoyladenylate synthase [Porphyromonas circumdentaria]SJZ53984.1 translation factor SUA5 [Porphyromonas circumdentaria]